MILKDQNVLFFTRTMQLGGTEKVILQMCEILKPYVRKLVVCSCGGINVEKLKELGIRHYEIPDIEKKDIKTICSVFHTLREVYRKEHITVIHVHHRMAAFYTRIFRLTRRFKFLATSHGIFEDKKRLTKFSYTGANIIACGSVVKDNLVNDYGLNSACVEVVHNAVQKENGEIRPVMELQALGLDVKKIGYVGRLSEEKGIDNYIAFIPYVLKEVPSAKFVIAGDGPLRTQMLQQIKKLKIEDDVIYLGYRNDIQNVIQQLDIIVLPSYTEGLPLTPIEAFAHGKPMVATAVGGTVEIVKDGVNGFLIQPDDLQQMAKKVVALCKDQVMYGEFGKQAELTYEGQYSFEHFQKSIIAYYEKIE